ncbi:MAG: AIM24 family protein, partial [Myxococcales bacterium]|nr:AIM24 family protein [Myxococcales bacterium]
MDDRLPSASSQGSTPERGAIQGAGPSLQGAGSSAGATQTPAHEITHGPSFAMLRVDLQPGQKIVAEAGAMVARHQHVAMEVKMNTSERAGFFAKLWSICIALIRKLVGGETFFVNHFTSEAGPGSVWIAPTLAG